MAYNMKTDTYTCGYCGEETGSIGNIKSGANEDGDHLNPFSCIKHLKNMLSRSIPGISTNNGTVGFGSPKDW